MRAWTKAILAAGLAATALAAGCNAILGNDLNPRFCRAHPSDPDCMKMYPDAAPPNTCASDQQCTGATPVCDLGPGASMTCVECTAAEHGLCSGATPACVDAKCVKCTTHAQCDASNVCLPDGTCADATQVAYVDQGGTDNDVCTKATPCTRITKGIATSRPYVKVHGTVDEPVSIDIPGKVTLLGDPGAKLTRTTNGLLLEVRGSSQVDIYDLEISGASGTNNPGISLPSGNAATLSLTRSKVLGNTGSGIAASGGTVTVTQSTISGNQGGGVFVNGSQYDISNSYIVNNGGPNSAIGGASVGSIVDAGTHRFEFNTVAGNQAKGSLTAGLFCSAIAVPLAFANSIVYGNGLAMQVEGTNCTWNYSDVGQVLLTGAGDINQDPKFIDVNNANYHLQAGSPAENVADPASTTTVDFDGDTRPQGGRSDMGADEVKQ